MTLTKGEAIFNIYAALVPAIYVSEEGKTLSGADILDLALRQAVEAVEVFEFFLKEDAIKPLRLTTEESDS